MPDSEDLEDATATRPTLRRRLATMLGFAVMPALVLSVADGVRRYTRVAAERDAAFVAAAQQDAQVTRDNIVATRATLVAVAANPAVAAFAEPACSAYLRSLVAQSVLYRLAVVTDVEGRVRCASRRTAPGVSFADDPDRLRLLGDPGFHVGVRAAGRITGEEVLVASTPVIADGALVGSVSISLSAATLRYFAAVEESPDATQRAIVDADGAVLIATPAGDTASWLPADPAWTDWLPRQATTLVADGGDGRRRVFGLSPFIAERAWLVSAADTGDVYDEAVLRVLPAIAAPLLMLIIAVGVSYFALDRLVVRHLDYLARLARAYGRGRLELKPRIADNAPAEIASLFRSVGSMAGDLAERERELRESAEANRILLLEVYHRVRNNLQMIASLLNLQMRRAETDIERAALARIRDRVHSLALVHEKLYESRRVDALDLGELVGAIARALLAARGAAGGAPALDIAIDVERCVSTPDVATPLALFVNEALLNAIKHGGKGEGRQGQGGLRVALALRARPDGGVDLVIENDVDVVRGSGDRSVAGPRAEAGALGLSLMESFARQLRADFRRRRVGARHVVELSLPPPTRAAA
jgi:two-component sensor histidine kinase